ncbi:hypothetical protein [Pseudobacteriovorax antillogorgiicola]|uniref:Outer membrane efflux protein n=1 Tax=Pseudobacteriovorax antillogorgiicola TaxID=1513793 RepID=A0A1Y6BVV9_9BACT|nr:hypothetical protein [Pseudobacteriovorax antillogorgiicola]TCS52291.1 hypothetical protein EDD56_10935 [Pseudobacteriovorax antillogorgiicola]SMF30539.1 hypothetical protein SAMN06296036_109178 [Pseudobacteriovorax antillogorgiicola]
MIKKIFGLAFLLHGLTSHANTIELETPENEIELQEFIKDLREKKLPQLDQIHSCYLSANYLADIYKDTKSHWVEKSKPSLPLLIYANEQDASVYDMNIFNNFDGIIESEKLIESNLIQFIKDYDPSDFDKSTIRDRLAEIDAGQTSLADSLLKTSQRESMFLYLVNQAEIQLREFDSTYAPHIGYIKSESCENSNVVSLLTVFQDDIKASLANIGKLRDYVVRLRPKRNKLVEEVFTKVRDRLVEQYANLTFEDLEAVQKQLLDIIRLDNLGAEMITWWQGESAKGLAGNLHLKYLEYERPLRLLRLLGAKLHRFEGKINKLIGAPEASRSLYLQKLEAMQSTLSRNLDRLESSGWRGQRDRQVLINQRRMQQADRYSSECVRDIERHLEAAEETTALATMTRLEQLYRDSVESCSRR